MRAIIAGSRTVSLRDVHAAMTLCRWRHFISMVVSGAAKGADTYGEMWAIEQNVAIAVFAADWKRFKKRAGPMRNQEMARNADSLVAVWDGVSRGTSNMITLAQERGLRILVFKTDTQEVSDYAPFGHVADLWADAEERAAVKEYSSRMSRAQAEREAGYETAATSRAAMIEHVVVPELSTMARSLLFVLAERGHFRESQDESTSAELKELLDGEYVTLVESADGSIGEGSLQLTTRGRIAVGSRR